MAPKESPQSAPDVNGSSLSLLRIPFIFTQDKLLDTSDFCKAAKERGFDISEARLQELHSSRLLLPLFRVSDTPSKGRRIDVRPTGAPNVHGWVLDAAAAGRLRDPMAEGYSSAWPYRRPSELSPFEWWNGFAYSSWQLLELRRALNGYQLLEHGFELPMARLQVEDSHRLTLALTALAPRYLPGILGQMSIPFGFDEEALWKFRSTSDVRELLQTAGFDPSVLQDKAEWLLAQAHKEPLAEWLPLLRYASYGAWSKLKGEPLDSMWYRVAAEILLRAHEDLAAAGELEPLPDLSGSTWWSPLHDRLTPRGSNVRTLERALTDLGLSPHPRVILLVEGETELEHLPQLLVEFGITVPGQVRVQAARSSQVNPQLLARYGATPRVGLRLGKVWQLDTPLTAIFVVMDPENSFATQEKRDKMREGFQKAIREEVRHQGANIGDDVLNALAHIQVWGEDSYELANFTDDELMPAITKLAIERGNAAVNAPGWEQQLRARLQEARAKHIDYQKEVGKLGVREDKPGLARLLWPVLRAKCEREYVQGAVETPVLRIVLEVREIVAKLTGVNALADV